MEVLRLQDLKRYNILGLKAICSHNRDILSSFHFNSRQELEKRIINILDNNQCISIPYFIINNNDFFLQYPKKK